MQGHGGFQLCENHEKFRRYVDTTSRSLQTLKIVTAISFLCHLVSCLLGIAGQEWLNPATAWDNEANMEFFDAPWIARYDMQSRPPLRCFDNLSYIYYVQYTYSVSRSLHFLHSKNLEPSSQISLLIIKNKFLANFVYAQQA